MNRKDPAERRPHRLGTATRLAAFLALLLAAILSVTAWETSRAFANQSVASVTRSLVSAIDSYGRATAGKTPATLEPATVAYLQSQVLVKGESLMVALPSGVRLGSEGSAGLLRDPTIRGLLGSPPADTVTRRATLDGVDTLVLASPSARGTWPWAP